MKLPARRTVLLSFFVAAAVLAAYGFRSDRPGSSDAAAGWQPIGPEGGTVAALSAARDNPGDVLALVLTNRDGPAYVFQSLNGGYSWKRIARLSGQASDLKRAPSDPSIVYALGSDRIFKSVNGGKSWQSVLFGETFFSYGRIAVSVSDPDRVYVSGSASSPSWDTCMAVNKSTDGGATWTVKKIAPGSKTGQAYPLVLDPLNPLALYVGGYVVTDTDHPRLYKSADGGETWKNITGPIGDAPDAIAVDPRDSKHLTVACEFGLYTSRNGGVTWQRAANNVYGYALAADPGAPGTIFAGADARIFKSVDGGRVWRTITKGLFGAVTSFAFSAAGTLAGTTCGLFGSADSGKSWRPAHSGITQAQVMALAVAPSAPDNLYASVFGYGLIYSADGGVAWEKKADIGRGTETYISQIAVHTKAPHLVYALFFGGPATSGIYRSPDAGHVWTRILAKSVNGVAVHERYPGFVFAAGRSQSGTRNVMTLYACSDGGDDWSTFPISSAWPSLPYALACHPTDPGIVYMGGARLDSYRGVLHKTTDGGKTWSQPSYSNEIGEYPYALAVDPGNPERILLAATKGVYISANGGQSWLLMPSSKRITAFCFDPKSPGVVYGAGWEGVQRSLDGGKTWEAFNTGLAVRYVQGLALDPARKILYAATQGGGVFKRQL